MIIYVDGGDLACLNGYSFRKDKKTGYYLSSRVIGNRRKRLHVYVWELMNGPVPKGYYVHHKDGNKNNNEIDNLAIMKGLEHIRYHGRNLSKEERRRRADRVKRCAMPKAKEWHRSKEGRAWHSEHAKAMFSDLPQEKYECTYCGKEFLSRKRYGKKQNTFCSNNCRAAYRRKSGVDNIEKTCERCGKKYIANKYQKTKYCEECKRQKN